MISKLLRNILERELICNFKAFLKRITIYTCVWSLEIMVKLDAVYVKILTVEDLFYLKPYPWGREPCNLGSCAQKLECVCKGNDFEVLYPRPEINIHVL